MYRHILVFLVTVCEYNFFPLVKGMLINKKIIVDPKFSHHSKLIVLSIDGFRYDFIEKTETPTLDKLRSEGVYSPYMKPQFPTKTFPNHQSIATGLYAESHGITDNEVFDPKYDAVLSGFDKVNEKFWNFRADVVPIWILNEWAGNGRFSGALWPGANVPYGENKTFPSHYLSYDKSLSFEARMDFVLKWLTDPEKPANLVFMYFDEPDGKSHAFGPESSEVIQQIRKIDSTVEYLLKKLEMAGFKDEVNILIVSDHGSQEISKNTEISISEMADRSLYKVYGDSPILQIAPLEGKFKTVYNALIRGSEGRKMTVYIKEELLDRWHYKRNRRTMPIVLVANIGYNFIDYNNRTSKFITNDEERKRGTHGYDNRQRNMRAFFLAYGPSFKKGILINPFDNIDIFPLVCKLINVTAAANNGTLNTVGTALKQIN